MPRDNEPDGSPEPASPDPAGSDPDWIETLYAQSASVEPPAALDARIHNAARQAVRPWYSNRRTLTSFATAASLVLAALVVYLAPDTQQSTPQLPAREAVTPASPAPAAAPTAPAAPSSNAESAQEPQRLRESGRSMEAPQAKQISADSTLSTGLGRGAFEAAGTKAADRAVGMRTRVALPADCGQPTGSQGLKFHQDERGGYLQLGSGEEAEFWRCHDDRWTSVANIDNSAQSQSAEQQ